jgi:hypothetical protein
MKKFFTLIFLFACYAGFALDANHFTITRISAPYFIVDANSPATITSAYVGFEVKNNTGSAVTYSGIKLAITGINTSVAGQNYALLSPVNGITNIGTLAPGESKICYYYVSYPAHTTAQGTFNLQLSNNTPGVKTQSIVVNNRSCISANAGGTATQSFTNQDLIGGIVIDEVTYAVGNAKNGDETDFQVAVSSQFDPTKILLLKTEVISSTVPGIVVGATDSLYYVLTANASTGATVTVRWTFRIAGFNFTTYLLPCAGSTSGASNYKYALNSALGQGSPVTVSAAANPLTITKTSDKSTYLINTPAIFTVTICNPAAFGVTIDKITDELPAGFTFQNINAGSDVTSTNATTTPSAGATGTITFDGGVASGVNNSFYIPAGGCISLQYTATAAPASASNLTTTARDFVGTTQVGAAQNTVSVVSVLPVKWLNVTATISADAKAMLSWTVAESNVLQYEIQQSVNGVDFISGGVVNTKGDGQHQYDFIAAEQLKGKTYYRIKQTDRNGVISYSKTVLVYSNRTVNEITVYPNPFAEIVTIATLGKELLNTKAVLTDVTGKVVQYITLNQKITMLNLGNYASGTYLLTLQQGAPIKLIKK